MTLPPDSTPPNGASPGQPSDDDALKAALRDVLGDLLPQFERHVLEQVDARIAERNKAADPSMLLPQVVESLRPLVTEQINGVAARLQGQINEAAAHFQGMAPTTPVASGAQEQPDKLDKVEKTATNILAMVDTFMDKALPKLMDVYDRVALRRTLGVFRDPVMMQQAMQIDPVGTLYFAQMRNPNPNEAVIPQATFNGASMALRMMGPFMNDLRKEIGKPWQNPQTPSQPSPSASSYVAPSLPSPMLPGQTPPAGSGVSMSEMQQPPVQLNGNRPTTPVLRISLAPKGNAPGTGRANGPRAAPRRKTLAEAMEG